MVWLLVALTPLFLTGDLGGSGHSASIYPAEESYAGACALLPQVIPILTNASNGALFPYSPNPPTNAGLPQVPLNGASSSSGGPELTSPNVTVGVVRSIWSQVCASPDFIQPFQNLSPSNQTYRQFWYSAGWQGGAAGTVSIEPGYNWDATCTGNTTWSMNSSSSGPEPFVVRPLSPPPAYSGSGCTYWEYWDGNITSAGTTNLTGPFLFEASTANFVGPTAGAETGGRPVMAGAFPFAYVVGALIGVGVVTSILLVTRPKGLEGRELSDRPWPGGHADRQSGPRADRVAGAGEVGSPSGDSSPVPPRASPPREPSAGGVEPANDPLDDLL
jgi:hypothetical protein